jgi:hypothetical protein
MTDSQPTKMEVFAAATTKAGSGAVVQVERLFEESNRRMGSISAKSKAQKASFFKYMQGFKRRKMASFRIFPFQPSIGMLGLGQK